MATHNLCVALTLKNSKRFHQLFNLNKVKSKIYIKKSGKIIKNIEALPKL